MGVLWRRFHRLRNTPQTNFRIGTKGIEAGWLVLAAFLPFCFAPWGRNPFELPKVLLLWFVAALMGAAWLVQRPAHRLPPRPGRSSRRHQGLGVLVLALVAVLLLSTILSQSPLQSAQGSYERMQGTLTALGCLALYLLLACALREKDQVRRLLTVIAWGSMPVMGYALVQAAGVDPILWQTEGSPIMSTLGRSNFLGAYLVLVLPLTWASARHSRSRAQRIATLALMATQLLCLVATQARAAWLGTLAAGAVLLLIEAWSRGHRRLAVTGAALGAAALVAGLGFLALYPGLGGSIGARATIWRATTSLIAARPLLGYGPETFAQVFTTVYPPELVYLQGRAVIVDRAHNLLLDTLASGGVAGLLALAALVAATVATGLQTLVRTSDGWVRTVLAAGLAAVVGHLVETQLSFSLTTTAVLFWLALGLLVAPWSDPPALREPVVEGRGSRRRARTLLAALLLATVVPLSARLLIADAHAGRANRTATLAQVQDSIAAAERAAALWPGQPDYHLRLGWLHLQRTRLGGQAPADYRAAEAELDRARRLTPGDYRIWAGYGELYLAWGQDGDAARFAQAESAYRQATARFPGSAMLHTGWGLLYDAQDRPAEAEAQFHQAISLDNTDARAYLYLGDTLLAQGKLGQAEEAYRNALRWAPDLADAYRGLGQVYHRWDWPDTALTVYAHALELAPADPDLYLDVARCYWDLGQKEPACRFVERGLLLAADHPDLLAFRTGCFR